MTPAPGIPILVDPEWASFDITGRAGREIIDLSSSGFAAIMRIGDASVQISFSFSVRWVYISVNTVVLTLTASNAATEPRTVDFAVTSDNYFDGNLYCPVIHIPPSLGFVLIGPRFAGSFICRGLPLVRSVLHARVVHVDASDC